MTTNNPRPQTWPEVAADMFATGKRLSPARFPALPRKDDPEALTEFDALCQVWGEELEHINLTPRIWVDVVRWWCRNSGPDARWDIAEARRAGYRVRELWEQDPEKRAMLDQWRQWYLSQRVARGEIPAGATPVVAVNGASRQELVQGEGDGVESWRRLRAELRRRRDAEAAAEKATRLEAEASAAGAVEGAA